MYQQSLTSTPFPLLPIIIGVVWTPAVWIHWESLAIFRLQAESLSFLFKNAHYLENF
jgi:hypothetical protein